MIRLANDAAIPVILDASGNNLLEVFEDKNLHLKAIKPNIDELSAIEEKDFGDDFEVIKEALKGPRYETSEWIVLSLDGAGSLVKHGDNFYRLSVLKINVVSPVGSGDSTVAGLAYDLLSGKSDEGMMKAAMMTGVLNTMNEQTGSIDFSRFNEIFNQIKIEKYKKN